MADELGRGSPDELLERQPPIVAATATCAAVESGRGRSRRRRRALRAEAALASACVVVAGLAVLAPADDTEIATDVPLTAGPTTAAGSVASVVPRPLAATAASSRGSDPPPSTVVQLGDPAEVDMLPSLSRPVLGVHWCTPVSASELTPDGPIRFFARSSFAAVPVQVVATAAGVEGPYAIVLRYADGARTLGGGDRVDVGGVEGRLLLRADGAAQLGWLLADGTEASIRSRGLGANQLIDIAAALGARPADALVPGFDIVGALPDGLSLVAEAIDPITRRAATSTCRTAAGEEMRVGVVDADEVARYAVGVDTAVLAALDDRGDRVVWATARSVDPHTLLGDIVDAPAEAWNRLRHADARAASTTVVTAGAEHVMTLQAVDEWGAPTSTFTSRIVDREDATFLEVDANAAVAPPGAAYWEVHVDGRLRLRTTAGSGGTLGVRLDGGLTDSGVAVSVLATSVTGLVVAATG